MNILDLDRSDWLIIRFNPNIDQLEFCKLTSLNWTDRDPLYLLSADIIALKFSKKG